MFFQAEYFRLLGECEKHVAVHMVHIDTDQCGSAFPDRKDSPYARYAISCGCKFLIATRKPNENISSIYIVK